MRIVFLSATEIGWHCCNTLVEMRENVVGILTIPQSFGISWSDKPVKNAQYRTFEDLGSMAGIPVHCVSGRLTDAHSHEILAELRPDILIVIGWYHMVPQRVLANVPAGAVGIHASLLPEYRGGAPLVWAIINGERRTGVTLFHFDRGVDDGDIIAQSAFEINASDDISDILKRATQHSEELIRECVPLLREGTAPRVAQGRDRATTFPQRCPEDGEISWSTMTDRQIHDWVRAQTHPYPGAFTWINGLQMRVWSTEIVSAPTSCQRSPGSVCSVSKSHGMMVQCKQGNVAMTQVGVNGETMSGTAFAEQYGINPGSHFREHSS